MPLAVKLFALIPFWGGLDLMVGKMLGHQHGLIGLWDLILDVALPAGNAIGMSPVDVFIAIGVWAVASLMIILINLFMPAKA